MLDEVDLSKVIKKYGEDTQARKIAHAIVQARAAYGRIATTKQLAAIVENVCTMSRDKLGRYSHPATKLFQALRIFVNNELNELNAALEIAHTFLKPGGLCIAITFHSLEDRIVKRHFHDIDLDEEKNLSLKQKLRNVQVVDTVEELQYLTEKRWKPVNKKVLTTDENEVEDNPRSRSAKLRAAIKSSQSV
ncbi:12S rRNA N4-methylcytidine methyltransferase-like [Dreissena polymorpha]|uniref:Uncharacterized protein n=1 Tax=Dreissena polymorpha TaxID=45954 RepID=A0A9D4N4V1_DREPO|nr:12S rRNA N4-methylcytidine methyltransferase-like [Dreissena polymorpha]KAH3887861.1 hypothetical protein DPMN_011883 [Dreissena polymorpha]